MSSHAIFNLSNLQATRLTPLGTHSGIDMTIQNISDTAYVYIGGEGVTSISFGYKLSPGHAISFELPSTDALYAIASQNNTKIATMNVGLEVSD